MRRDPGNHPLQGKTAGDRMRASIYPSACLQGLCKQRLSDDGESRQGLTMALPNPLLQTACCQRFCIGAFFTKGRQRSALSSTRPSLHERQRGQRREADLKGKQKRRDTETSPPPMSITRFLKGEPGRHQADYPPGWMPGLPS